MTHPQQHPQPASVPSQPAPPAKPTSNEPAAPAGSYPTSFAQIVELIESGKPIPGIEEIPDTVLTGQEGPSKEKRRMKPWETSDVREDGVKNGGGLGTELYSEKKET